MGRVAAVVAAAIAGIVSLPALLGGDAPPPVPPDVGLTQAALPPAPPVTARPPAPSTRPKRLAHSHRRARPAPIPRRQHLGHHRHTTAAVPTLPPVPAYTPSYTPPPPRGEFQIEP